MPFTPYVASLEYALYGITDASPAQVANACRVVNSYLGRPEGLLWSPDANGQPAYMTNMSPTLSLTGPAIAPGTGVTLTVPFARFGYQNTGDVVILDRATPGLTEACVVTIASGNTLTLANVQFAHPAPTIDFGLTILEEMSGRVRLARSPVANVFCGFGRHGYGREMNRIGSGFDYFEELLVTNYGLNAVSGWNQLDTTLWDINYATGAVRTPPHGHENIRLRYVAGWSQTNLPGDIKQAVANLVRSAIDTPFSANMKVLKAGDGTMERFGPSVMDADTKALLQPYKAVRI